jgi:hypothetical protein
LIGLGRGDYNFSQQQVAPPPQTSIPNPYGSVSPFDFGITTPLETAPDTPLYGLENVGQPIDSPFFLGYSERPIQLDYKPPPLEFR